MVDMQRRYPVSTELEIRDNRNPKAELQSEFSQEACVSTGARPRTGSPFRKQRGSHRALRRASWLARKTDIDHALNITPASPLLQLRD